MATQVEGLMTPVPTTQEIETSSHTDHATTVLSAARDDGAVSPELDVASEEDFEQPSDADPQLVEALTESAKRHIIGFPDSSVYFPARLKFGGDPPTHESITMAAFIQADPHKVFWTNVAVNNMNYREWEVIRGIYWNDDPDCNLFKASTQQNNHKFSTGFKFGTKFTTAEAAARTSPLGQTWNMLARSHFGDLQFIHAMAIQSGEDPNETRTKCLLWAEVMYKVASEDGISATSIINDISVTAVAPSHNSYSLKQFFNDNTKIKGTDTIYKLLAGNDTYAAIDIPKRAFGSLLHLIQDSYAKGHTRRESNQSGAIAAFHSYIGQDHTQHKRWDNMDLTSVNVSVPDTFKSWPGAFAALRDSTEVISMWLTKPNPVKWEDPNGPRDHLSNTVFRLSATPSNSNTDV